MFKYVLSLLCVVSVGHIPSIAVAQNLDGGYSDCSCVTPALSTADSTGLVTSAKGDVLVDGLSAESNKILNANSQILVGDGNAAITVGQSCQISIPSNTQVSISQPGGPGSNLCLQRLDAGVAQAPESGIGLGALGGGTSALIAAVAVIGAVTLVAVASDSDLPRQPASN